MNYWSDIFYAIAGVPSLLLLIRIAIKDKSLSNVFFSGAVLSFLVGILVGYVSNFDSTVAREWGDLLAITFVLCALFVKIRDSKPVFARFPVFLTFIPLVSVFFYPLIIDAQILKNLLTMVYQGGALVVGFLILIMNQYLLKNRMLLIVSLVIFLMAYISFWLVSPEILEYHEEFGSILFTIGVVVATLGLKKVSETKSYPK